MSESKKLCVKCVREEIATMREAIEDMKDKIEEMERTDRDWETRYFVG